MKHLGSGFTQAQVVSFPTGGEHLGCGLGTTLSPPRKMPLRVGASPLPFSSILVFGVHWQPHLRDSELGWLNPRKHRILTLKVSGSLISASLV